MLLKDRMLKIQIENIFFRKKIQLQIITVTEEEVKPNMI